MIRAARLEDEATAVELIALSMGPFGDALFGLGDPALNRRAVAHFYRGAGTRFSHDLVELEELEGSPAGLLLSLPGRDLGRLQLPMARSFGKIYGLWGSLRLLARTLRFAADVEALADEYYVSNLAVLPARWGQGIGRRLLERAEDKARQARLAKCSLTVEMENTRARALYERTGYQIVHTYATPDLVQSMGTAGHLRMVKILSS